MVFFVPSSLANLHATRFVASLLVRAKSKSDSAMPASSKSSTDVPLPAMTRPSISLDDVSASFSLFSITMISWAAPDRLLAR